MVVSGLPIRNGKQHAKEVSLMALHFMKAIRTITVDHMKDYKLAIRSGINTGTYVDFVTQSVLIDKQCDTHGHSMA